MFAFKRISSVIAAGMVATLASSFTAQAQLIGIGTHAVGGAFHAAGVGFANMVTRQADVRLVVQPYAGPNAWMPDFSSGVLETGLLSAIDAAWAFRGEHHFDEPVVNMRLLFQGNQLANVGWITYPSSDLQSISDMRGRRAVSDFGGVQVTRAILESALRSVDLDWDDIVPVPVTDLGQSITALREQRVEAAWGGSPDSGVLLELDSAVGVRYLPFGDLEPDDLADGVPKDMQAILDEILPGSTLAVVTAGSGAVHEDTVMISYPLVVIGNAETLSEDAAYQITKAVWEHADTMSGAHPWLAEWAPETMLMENAPVPYHDGAIRFFQETGVWTDELEAHHQSLLEQANQQ